jgi:hypothetical protein
MANFRGRPLARRELLYLMVLADLAAAGLTIAVLTRYRSTASQARRYKEIPAAAGQSDQRGKILARRFLKNSPEIEGAKTVYGLDRVIHALTRA